MVPDENEKLDTIHEENNPHDRAKLSFRTLYMILIFKNEAIEFDVDDFIQKHITSSVLSHKCSIVVVTV